MSRRKVIVLSVIVFLLILARALAPAAIRNYANKKLSEIPGYKGHVERVVLNLYRGAYTFYDMKVEKEEGQKTYPFFNSQQVEVSVLWKKLLHGKVVAKVLLVHPVMNFTTGRAAVQKQAGIHPAWKSKASALTPFKIDDLKVEDGEVYFRKLDSDPPVNIYVKQLWAEAHDLSTMEKDKDLFTTVKAHGLAMDSGKLALNVKVLPFKKPIEFKLTGEIVGMDMRALNPFFKAYGDFDVDRGYFSVYTELATEDNDVVGYVKPVFRDVDVAQWKQDKGEGLFHFLWENIVGTAAWILKNQPKDQQAARIPIKGTLKDPKADAWAAIGSVLQNAFVRAIVPKIEHSVSLNDVKKSH